MKRRKHLLCACAALVLALVVGVTGLGAQQAKRITSSPQIHLLSYNRGSPWSYNDYVGYCGDGSGGFVVLAQAYLMNDGLYPASLYQVDNYFGPATYSAVQAYQQYYGLTPDGCVGPATWNMMQQTESLNSVGLCSASEPLLIYGDGGTATNGDGGAFTYAPYTSVNGVSTSNDVGGPVAALASYAFYNVLVQQDPCTGAFVV